MQTYLAGIQHLRVAQLQNDPGTTFQQSTLQLPETANDQQAHAKDDQHTHSSQIGAAQQIALYAQQSSNQTQVLNTQNSDNAAIENSNDFAQQHEIGRKVYISLAPHNGSAVGSFLTGVSDPSEWEVFLFEAPTTKTQHPGAEQLFKVMHHWQQHVNQLVTFPEAAGDV